MTTSTDKNVKITNKAGFVGSPLPADGTFITNTPLRTTPDTCHGKSASKMSQHDCNCQFARLRRQQQKDGYVK